MENYQLFNDFSFALLHTPLPFIDGIFLIIFTPFFDIFSLHWKLVRQHFNLKTHTKIKLKLNFFTNFFQKKK